MNLSLTVKRQFGDVRANIVSLEDGGELHTLGDGIDHAGEDISTHAFEPSLGRKLLHGSLVVIEDSLIRMEGRVLCSNQRVLGRAGQVLGDNAVMERRDVLLEGHGSIVVGVSLDLDDLGEVDAVHAADSMTASNHSSHVLLSEAGLGEGREGILQVGRRLRDTRWTSLEGIDSASTERNVRTLASSDGKHCAEGCKVRSAGARVVEAMEKAEGVVEGQAWVLRSRRLPVDRSIQATCSCFGIVCDDIVEGCSEPFGRVLLSRIIASERASSYR